MTIEQIEPRVTLSLDSRIGQSTLLFGSMIVAMGLTFVTSVMTTRFLGPSAYGDLKFIQTFWALLALISTFGLLYSGSRVLLLEDDRGNSREVIGATLFIALIIGLFIAFISASGAKIIDGIFGTQISQTLIMLAPLTLALPLRTSLLLILQSENRITWISFIYIMPPILFLVGLFLIWILTKPNTGNVLFVRMVTELMILGFIVVLLKPKFGSFSKWWHVIRAQNKT
ncbi:MAG: oligosaccharide flippase family protein, partial [Anaerolineales bacterium]|nr:oligosaccharide flippase family protein [Anaerolineales bacterium]